MSKKKQLTPLQQQIYNLIVKNGTKTKDIALILYRSQHTIERNIEIILEAYGVESQKELIVKHYKDIITRGTLCPNVSNL
jgi:DNA-binding NarL/FixJ family response regulator